MEDRKARAAEYVERLLRYGMQRNLMSKWDLPQIRNQLLDILWLDEPFYQLLDEESHDDLTDILKVLLDYAVEIGLIKDTVTERDLLDARLMAQLLPRQSELVNRFGDIEKKEGIEAATDYFYRLSLDSNYIRADRMKKNIHWLTETKYGTMEITINLSKPEKDPKEIEAQKNTAQSGYPKCLLCLENVGYAGRLNHPARSNHRVIPVELCDEQWYFQYSPYEYYNEHAIILSEEHRPMSITAKTFDRLIEFLDKFPHYFIGSNADLPIVGGSILSHDHFQGGRHSFPMERALVLGEYVHSGYKNTEIQMLKWPLSIIRLVSGKKEEITGLANAVLNKWRQYSDEDAGIIPFTGDVPHNTITPIARKNKDGKYVLDLALRNNRSDADHPDGIFHPHKHLHHIKKENIGLIEVMGLAILPDRLKPDTALIQEVLTGKISKEKAFEEETIKKHIPWIESLVSRYGRRLNQEEAEKAIKDALGQKFTEVLECSGVFKQTPEGLKAFERFILSCLDGK